MTNEHRIIVIVIASRLLIYSIILFFEWFLIFHILLLLLLLLFFFFVYVFSHVYRRWVVRRLLQWNNVAYRIMPIYSQRFQQWASEWMSTTWHLIHHIHHIIRIRYDIFSKLNFKGSMNERLARQIYSPREFWLLFSGRQCIATTWSILESFAHVIAHGRWKQSIGIATATIVLSVRQFGFSRFIEHASNKFESW